MPEPAMRGHGSPGPVAGVPLADVLRHVDLALDGMCATLRDLGDELVNVRPELPGANSAYALVRHCCGVLEHWGGTELAGRPVERDRDAEFVATGTVAELVALVAAQRERFGRDLAGEPGAGGHDTFDGSAPALGAHERDGVTSPERQAVATRGGVLMHVYEELAQHRGHLDLTADLVRREQGAGGTQR